MVEQRKDAPLCLSGSGSTESMGMLRVVILLAEVGVLCSLDSEPREKIVGKMHDTGCFMTLTRLNLELLNKQQEPTGRSAGRNGSLPAVHSEKKKKKSSKIQDSVLRSGWKTGWRSLPRLCGVVEMSNLR